MFALERRKFVLVSMSLLGLLVLGSCSVLGAARQDEQTEHGDHTHEEGAMDEMEHQEEGGEVARIPNNGAVIKILAPATGTTFSAGEPVGVEVAVENFELDMETNHWHIYVDGTSWGMVMGQDTSHVLQGLEPGEHRIEVFLSVDMHQELEHGDSIIVQVGE